MDAGVLVRILDACGLAYRMDPGQAWATLSLVFEGRTDPIAVMVTIRPGAIIVECAAKRAASLDVSGLELLNRFNARAIGVWASWDESDGRVLLRCSLPLPWTFPVDAEIAGMTLEAAVLCVGAHASRIEKLPEVEMEDDPESPAQVQLDDVVRSYGRYLQWAGQPDGTHAALVDVVQPAYLATISFGQDTGLVFAASALDGALFPVDETTYRWIARLNTRLVSGPMVLFPHGGLMHRQSTYRLWLSTVSPTPGQPGSLLDDGYIQTTIDAASSAWEDVLRIAQGGPIDRPA